jgi:hypothetical protein
LTAPPAPTASTKNPTKSRARPRSQTPRFVIEPMLHRMVIDAPAAIRKTATAPLHYLIG